MFGLVQSNDVVGTRAIKWAREVIEHLLGDTVVCCWCLLDMVV